MKKWIVLFGSTAMIIILTFAIQVYYAPPVSANTNSEDDEIEIIKISESSKAGSSQIQQRVDTGAKPAYYHLSTVNDMVALFDEEGRIVEVYEIYAHLLPPEDVAALAKGIIVENETQLRGLLEDLGG